MRQLLSTFFCVLITASVAFADGVGPQRKMTGAEAAAYSNVTSTLQRALPKAPSGYLFNFSRVSGLDEGMVQEGLKPTEMFRMAHTATYTLDTSDLGEQQRSASMDRARGTLEQQKRMAELNAKEAVLTQARDRSRDPAEKQKIRAELKAVRAEQSKLMAEIVAATQAWVASGGVEETVRSIDQAQPPKEFSISVSINADVSLSDKSAPCTITGAPLAFDLSDGCQKPDSYCVTVLLGDFDKIKRVSGYTLYQPKDVVLGVPTKARTMALTISGPNDRAESVREFAGKIDFAGLMKLLP